MKLNIANVLLAGSVVLCAPWALAQPFSIDWFTIAGGGGLSAGGTFALSGAAGQPEAGRMSDSRYTIEGGFWSTVVGAPQELIVNGGFENTSGAFVSDGSGVMSLPNDSGVIPGWTITDGELLWVNNGNFFGAATPEGQMSLDLTGYHDGPPYAGVTQTIPTARGQSYRLSLTLGSNADYPGAGGQKEVSVSVGSAGTTLTFDPPAVGGNEWSSRLSYAFTASSSSTVVSITGVTATGIYLGLDRVSVVHVPAEEEFTITAVSISGNKLRFRFPARPGPSYVIERRIGLATDAWAEASGARQVTVGASVEVSLSIGQSQPQYFYRVRQLP